MVKFRIKFINKSFLILQDLQLLFYGPSRYDDSKCLNPETVNFIQEQKQKEKEKEREALYDLGCTQVKRTGSSLWPGLHPGKKNKFKLTKDLGAKSPINTV